MTLNKFCFPYDDGITLTAADLIAHGAIPYKDFLIPYTPFYYYLLAFLFSVFGSNHLIARLVVIIMGTLISSSAFFFSQKIISRPSKIPYFSWLICVSAFIFRNGTILGTITPAMGLASLSFISFYFFMKKRGSIQLCISALWAGLTVLTRYDIGLYLIFSQISVLFLVFLTEKNKHYLCHFLRYGFSFLIFPALYIGYLISVGAFLDFIQALSSIQVIGHYSRLSPFPAWCWNPVYIFKGSMYFINQNQFYIPIFTYGLTALILGYEKFKNNLTLEKDFLIVLFLLFGSLSYLYVIYRSDSLHLIPVLMPTAVLISYLYDKRTYSRIILWVILILCTLLVFKNTDKFFKNTFLKVYFKKIMYLNTSRGGIFVPKEEHGVTVSLLRIIQTQTLPHENIFIWNAHSNLVSDYLPVLLYYFSEKIPPTKYHIVQPGYTNQPWIQKAIIQDLEKNKVKLIILFKNRAAMDSALDSKGSIDYFVEKSFSLYQELDNAFVYIRY